MSISTDYQNYNDKVFAAWANAKNATGQKDPKPVLFDFSEYEAKFEEAGTDINQFNSVVGDMNSVFFSKAGEYVSQLQQAATDPNVKLDFTVDDYVESVYAAMKKIGDILYNALTNMYGSLTNNGSVTQSSTK